MSSEKEKPAGKEHARLLFAFPWKNGQTTASTTESQPEDGREAVHRILHEFQGTECRGPEGFCDARDHADAIMTALNGRSAVKQPTSCIGCGSTTLVGYTMDRKPGPFCFECWNWLKASVREVDAHNSSVEGRESAENTLKSLAAMLGWGNVPPRETLERDIAALKARARDSAKPESAEEFLRRRFGNAFHGEIRAYTYSEVLEVMNGFAHYVRGES